jgi:hypothetical protein
MRGTKLNLYWVYAELSPIYTEYKLNVVPRILSISLIKFDICLEKLKLKGKKPPMELLNETNFEKLFLQS